MLLFVSMFFLQHDLLAFWAYVMKDKTSFLTILVHGNFDLAFRDYHNTGDNVIAPIRKGPVVHLVGNVKGKGRSLLVRIFIMKEMVPILVN